MVRTYRRLAAAIVGSLGILLVLAVPARATAGGDPAGNNGTIKVDGVPFDDAPDNEPHPGCVFQVDFYGFDAGDLSADVSFEAVSPTAGGVLLTDTVPIGEDSHAGGGSERGLDASKTYDLTTALAGIEPQRNQGWHVRLTVHADGSQGSDVKHKVFWVDDCTTTTGDVAAGSVAAGTETSNSSAGSDTAPVLSSPAPAPAPVTGAASVPASVLGTELAASPPSAMVAAALPRAQVLGETLTRGPASTAGASVLARTGIGLGLALLALTFIAGGALLMRLGAPGFVLLRS